MSTIGFKFLYNVLFPFSPPHRVESWSNATTKTASFLICSRQGLHKVLYSRHTSMSLTIYAFKKD